MMLLEKEKNHGRIKPKYNPIPNKAEKEFHEFARNLGCLVCGTPPSIHHVTTDGFKRQTRNHFHVTPLCPEHHQGDKGIHMLGHNAFTRLYGINLHNVAFEILELFKIRKDR